MPDRTRRPGADESIHARADLAGAPPSGGRYDARRGDLPQDGITETTVYRWKKHYAGLEASELRELKQLRDENRRLKHVVAELTLDKVILKDALAKNGWPNAATGGGGLGARDIPPEHAACVSRAGGEPSVDLVPIGTPRRCATPATATRARDDPTHVRESALAYPAAPRRTPDQLQEGAPALLRGTAPAQAAQAPTPPGGNGANTSPRGHWTERALGHGLHARHARRWPHDPRVHAQ